MIGMKPGSVLQLYKDPSITCTSVDERNKVDFRGTITSLSDAAMLAHKTLGTQPSALNGAWEWTFEGKRLDDLRRELEELLA